MPLVNSIPTEKQDPLDRFAAEAKRAIGRWYGTRMYFAAPRSIPPTFEEFIKAHWRRFPATDPTGGQIVDGEGIELHGFVEDPRA